VGGCTGFVEAFGGCRGRSTRGLARPFYKRTRNQYRGRRGRRRRPCCGS